MMRARTLSAMALLLLARSAAAQSTTTQPAWDTFADTWVATDGLGRTLPTSDQAGAPRADRHVGIFYYLWLPGGANDHAGPWDNGKILAADPDALKKPDSPLWGPTAAFHHWAEPLFGYYRMTDAYVLRKHAQMLADAGVEVVFFDTTNSYNYFDTVAALADAWLELQQRGQAVPHFAFTCRPGETEKVTRQIEAIYQTIYKNPKYAPLWYEWKGKPLILASPDAVGLSDEAKNFFAFRRVLWPGKPQPAGMWSLDNSLPYSDGNDRLGTDEAGKLEEMAAATAVSNAGGPMSTYPPVNSRAWRGRKDTGHLEADAGAIGRGGQFQDEFDFVLNHSPQPEMVMVYCWNEWLAQKFLAKPDGPKPVVAKGDKVFFVDEFSPDHSKDIEPMTGGFGDNYYWQMIANIRRYKGVRPIESLHSAPIQIDGDFADWRSVMPEFRDTLGDPARRDSDAFGNAAPHYKNDTGRNDLAAAKVSYDADRVYFYVRTAGPISAPGDDWMTLYLDADQNAKTGWLGYDLRISPANKSIEKNVGGTYQWTPVGTAEVAVGKDGIELSIPRSLVGDAFDFKLADHCYAKGDWTDFTLNGDAAPNDRFNYRAVLR